MTKAYDLRYLKDKGFFEDEIFLEQKLENGLEIEYFYDPNNDLVYFDSVGRELISDVVKTMKKSRNYDYYWFWEEGRICVFRTFGENKRFIYNQEHSLGTEWVKGKRRKLEEFSWEDPDILFRVREVVEHFYKRLWELRIKLAQSIKSGINEHEKIMAAQRLIDRLIFLYFLGKKGIIRALDSSKREMDLNVKEMFKHLIRNTDDFWVFLNSIFFNYLNNPKNNDMPLPGTEVFSLHIPYLNGGLFREKTLVIDDGKIDESELVIEGFEWSELIRELNNYNWIIDDYTAKEEEDVIGNLTPEILGHIYEKFVISVSKSGEIYDLEDLKTTSKGELQKGNKNIGAYYTPERITKYITEKTIFRYVADRIGEHEYGNFGDFFTANCRKGNSRTDILNQFSKELQIIRILDPAVGSGHFLMTAADHLLDWRKKCGEDRSDYNLKKDIIINNLFGVDIMEGAVEICKLRLWLWLIASQESIIDPEPLPNIDFNIIPGNSLVGFSEEEVTVGNQKLLPLSNLREDIELYKEKISEYKRKYEGAKQQKKSIEDLNQKMRKKLDKWYLQTTNRKLEKEFQDFKKARAFLTIGNDSESEISLKFQDYMSNETKGQLDSIGFRTWKKTAKVQINLRRPYSNQLQKLAEIERRNNNLESVIVTRNPTIQDLRETIPFHWIMEFPEVFIEKKGFDVVIGNPPYGNLLTPKEEVFMGTSYNTVSHNEIAANFMELEIEKLLHEGGYFGNITTSSILANSTMHELHKVIFDNLSNVYTSAFTRRPSKIFRSAEINVAITIGKKLNDEAANWKTTDFIRFSEKERRSLLENIVYGDVEGLILRDRIGGTKDADSYEVIPKVGDKVKESILRKIATQKRVIGDCLENSRNELYYRRAANYWMNTSLEKLSSAGNMNLLRFGNKLERNFSFIVLNSSLFYLYWMTYCNMHDVTRSQVRKFPMPSASKLEDYEDHISSLKEKLSAGIKENYHPNSSHQFRMGPVKPLIDEVEKTLIGQIYELNRKQIEYLQDYHSQYRR